MKFCSMCISRRFRMDLTFWNLRYQASAFLIHCIFKFIIVVVIVIILIEIFTSPLEFYLEFYMNLSVSIRSCVIYQCFGFNLKHTSRF